MEPGGLIEPAQPSSARRRLVIRVIVAAAIAILCAIGLRNLSSRALLDALRGARLPLVAAAIGVSLIQAALKSERWRLLLAQFARVSPLRLYHYRVVTNATSIVVPGPANEVLRVYLLRRRHGVTVRVSLQVAIIEKLFEGLGLALVVAPLPLLLPLARPIALFITACSAGGALITALALVIAARAERIRWSEWIARWPRLGPKVAFALGAPGEPGGVAIPAALRRPSLFASVTALSVGGHLLDGIAIKLLLVSVGLDLPFAVGVLVTLALSFALVVPLTPGHVGALEAGAVGALGLVGVPVEKALAFGLVLHALQVAPIVLLALTGAGLLGEARAEKERAE